MATIPTDYRKQGNCFAVYRNNVFMALFELEYQADIFIAAMTERYYYNRRPSDMELAAEWEKRTEYFQFHG